MILEHRVDFGVELDVLRRITEQVADHPHVFSIGKFDHHNQIRARGFQRGMSGMPYPFPAIDLSAPGDAAPPRLLRVASMANPFRWKLEGAALFAALDH